jgi:hypothetical protein
MPEMPQSLPATSSLTWRESLLPLLLLPLSWARPCLHHLQPLQDPVDRTCATQPACVSRKKNVRKTVGASERAQKVMLQLNVPSAHKSLPTLGWNVQVMVRGRWSFHGTTAFGLGNLLQVGIISGRIFALGNGFGPGIDPFGVRFVRRIEFGKGFELPLHSLTLRVGSVRRFHGTSPALRGRWRDAINGRCLTLLHDISERVQSVTRGSRGKRRVFLLCERKVFVTTVLSKLLHLSCAFVCCIDDNKFARQISGTAQF